MTFFGFTIAGLASVAVSFAGFLIGMRVAKERADRALLRTLYQDLYVHFRALRDAAIRGRPKDYSDFDLIGERYVSPMDALERDGQISLLPKSLARKMTEVEREMLMAGGRFKDEVGEKLAPIFTQAVEALATKPRESFSGRAYTPYNIGKLVLGETVDREVRTTVDGREIGVAFELMLEGARTSQLYLYQERLREGTVAEALSRLEEIISSHDGSKQQALALKAAIAKLDALLGSIAARIKDPHPFLETIREALPDVFRR